MRRLIASVISIIFTFIRFVFKKIFHLKGFSFKLIERFSPNVVVMLGRKSSLCLGNKVRAHSGCVFDVANEAKLTIGDDVSFNYGCKIVCHSSITIGNGVEIGPNVLVYDHDHLFDVETGVKRKEYKTGEVVIGKNCWIGANTVILRGTHIGDNCVVGAGSVIKGDYPAGSRIVQKRVTEIK